MLYISEHFYSIQAEGASVGVPAYFIRLQGCNLMSIGVKPSRRIPRVWTPNGRKKITSIKPGDIVLGVDENNKLVETVVKLVTNYEIYEHAEIKFQNQPSLYTSLVHPFLTNEGWKEAVDLKNKEILHFNYKEHMSYMMTGNKNPMKNIEAVQKRLKNIDYEEIGRKVSKTRRRMFCENKLETIKDVLQRTNKYEGFVKNLSDRMKTKNPMFDVEVVRKSNAAHNSKKYKGYASRTEYKFHRLCQKMGLPVKYIGDFVLPISIKNSNKHIYPDFIIENTNKVIEVLYSKGRYSNRDEEWKRKRKEIYNDAGYEVVFADFDDVENVKNLVKYELEALNGAKVLDVKIYNKKYRKKLNCYDITCYPYHTFIVDGLVTHNCGGSGGSLVKEGKATWWCDSEAVWRKGTETTNEQLEQTFIDQGLLDKILSGDIHLVWTGGEPLLPRNRKSIVEFLRYLEDKHPNNHVYNEMETNGTIALNLEDFEVLEWMQQINCSPKLANSGMPVEKRINPAAIEQIRYHGGYFKFVISTEDDIKEIQETYIKPFDIPTNNIIIMPGVDNRNDLPERTRFLFEMAKKYGYRAVTRQQILAWDRVCGV